MSISRTSRIRVFVGGALAVTGARALIWIPYSLALHDSVYVLALVVTALGLPLGYSLFRGRAGAARLAIAYLSLDLVAMSGLFALGKLYPLPSGAPHASWWSLFHLVIPAALLGLLCWSRTQKQQEEVEQSDAPNRHIAL